MAQIAEKYIVTFTIQGSLTFTHIPSKTMASGEAEANGEVAFYLNSLHPTLFPGISNFSVSNVDIEEVTLQSNE
jgi:hypothetical protein